MGYDRGDNFPFDFEPNGVPSGSKSKGKLSPRSYPIQFERKQNTSFFIHIGVVFPRQLWGDNIEEFGGELYEITPMNYGGHYQQISGNLWGTLVVKKFSGEF